MAYNKLTFSDNGYVLTKIALNEYMDVILYNFLIINLQTNKYGRDIISSKDQRL